MPLSQDQKKRFRSIAHHLKPVVMIAEKGISEGVLAELDRALEDHELIKLKVNVLEREDKQLIIAEVCQQTGAQLAFQLQNPGQVPLTERDEALVGALRARQPVTLWFEHDLYDQLQLVQVLVMAAPFTARAQSPAPAPEPGRPDFLFGRPDGSLALRGSSLFSSLTTTCAAR